MTELVSQVGIQTYTLKYNVIKKKVSYLIIIRIVLQSNCLGWRERRSTPSPALPNHKLKLSSSPPFILDNTLQNPLHMSF